MHGETLARKEGRRVRGRFGTGKSAAFGIGNTLIVDTVKNGRRNVVKLDLEELKQGLERIPIEELMTEQPVGRPDGTTIVINRLKLKRVKMESVKKFLRRSLSLQLRNHEVFVAGEKLVYSIPECDKEWSFSSPQEMKAHLGDCLLILRLSKRDLEEEEQGVAILSDGYPLEFYELSKAGPWLSRLFGEVDVPKLDTEDEIPAFDNTRSKLNRDNERVARLLQWTNGCVAQVISELEKEQRAKLNREESERLERTADELAEILNDDFSQIMIQLESSPQVGGVGTLESGVQEEVVGNSTYIKDAEGGTKVLPDQKGDVVLLEPGGGEGHGTEPLPDEPTRGTLSNDGIKAREAATSGEKRKRRGGFKIEYSHDGDEAFRAKWVREEMAIMINLDYPELKMFRDREDPQFKALSAEIAFSEYAVAAVNLEVEHGYVDVENNANEALIEYRRIINRLGRRIAPLMTRWFGEPSN